MLRVRAQRENQWFTGRASGLRPLPWHAMGTRLAELVPRCGNRGQSRRRRLLSPPSPVPHCTQRCWGWLRALLVGWGLILTPASPSPWSSGGRRRVKLGGNVPPSQQRRADQDTAPPDSSHYWEQARQGLSLGKTTPFPPHEDIGEVQSGAERPVLAQLG